MRFPVVTPRCLCVPYDVDKYLAARFAQVRRDVLRVVVDQDPSGAGRVGGVVASDAVGRRGQGSRVGGWLQGRRRSELCPWWTAALHRGGATAAHAQLSCSDPVDPCAYVITSR